MGYDNKLTKGEPAPVVGVGQSVVAGLGAAADQDYFVSDALHADDTKAAQEALGSELATTTAPEAACGLPTAACPELLVRKTEKGSKRARRGKEGTEISLEN